jgi:hypothetical protein
MSRTRPSIVVGAIAAFLCGQSVPALAQPAGAGAPSAPTAPSGPAPAPAGSTASSPPRARLSDAGELQRIVSLYSGGKYEDCTREVAQLLNPDNKDRLSNPEVIEEARLYHATCLVMSGREKEAIAPLRAALTQNPTMGTPDSLTFPPPLVSLFLQVRKEFADAIKAEEEKRLAALAQLAREAQAVEQAERARVKKLEELASTEVVILRGSRFVASLPFGIGQYQNGSNTLGTVFLLSESLLLGTSLAAVGVMGQQYSLIDPRAYGSDISRNAKIARNVAIVGFYGFAAVAAGGIVEAHVNFVPEVRSERKRALPKELRAPVKRPSSSALFLPFVTPSKSGLELGVLGAF